MLDKLASVKLCAGYKINGKIMDTPPIDADLLAECQPVYETYPGWQSSTAGLTDYNALPQKARDYLQRLEAVTEAPIDIISTGPDRSQTIMLRDPFK